MYYFNVADKTLTDPNDLVWDLTKAPFDGDMSLPNLIQAVKTYFSIKDDIHVSG